MEWLFNLKKYHLSELCCVDRAAGGGFGGDLYKHTLLGDFLASLIIQPGNKQCCYE